MDCWTARRPCRASGRPCLAACSAAYGTGALDCSTGVPALKKKKHWIMFKKKWPPLGTQNTRVPHRGHVTTIWGTHGECLTLGAYQESMLHTGDIEREMCPSLGIFKVRRASHLGCTETRALEALERPWLAIWRRKTLTTQSTFIAFLGTPHRNVL